MDSPKMLLADQVSVHTASRKGLSQRERELGRKPGETRRKMEI